MYGLERFREAQKKDYRTALSEIYSGRKETHWMWYIFPQIQGLGVSSISKYYAIRDLQEAKNYLKDPELGRRLNQISKALLSLHTNDPTEVFGTPDDMKLLSCMTLFEKADPENEIFPRVIDKYYGGIRDRRTLQILKRQEKHRMKIRNIMS